MRELANLTFVTLDGVMQAPVEPWEDRSGGFSSASWAKPYWDEVMAQVTEVAMAEPFDVLLGRNTYDNFHRASKEAGGNPFDAAQKYVVTSATEPLTWENSTMIAGDVPAQIRQLKSQGGLLMQVHGSWQLIQMLLEHDLVDEFRLWTFPVVLGEGKRLFSKGFPEGGLELVRTEPTGNGVVMSIYRRAG